MISYIWIIYEKSLIKSISDLDMKKCKIQLLNCQKDMDDIRALNFFDIDEPMQIIHLHTRFMKIHTSLYVYGYLKKVHLFKYLPWLIFGLCF